ncbi:hypothetical protein [Dechloromonas sp. A34]|uniref:hypothetical protein n=1 Tax=Dechloromonas sp. A34 TaxID=447588 RepID=UPI0022489435|nr:hypothetical protein [Dechloromonas sp. A34]
MSRIGVLRIGISVSRDSGRLLTVQSKIPALPDLHLPGLCIRPPESRKALIAQGFSLEFPAGSGSDSIFDHSHSIIH